MPEPDLRSGMKEVLGSEFTEMLCVGRPHMGLGQLPGWLEDSDWPGSASVPCRSSINVVGCPHWLWLLSVPLIQTPPPLVHTRLVTHSSGLALRPPAV